MERAAITRSGRRAGRSACTRNTKDRFNLLLLTLIILSRPLSRKYYKGYIPHVVVVDKAGLPLYNNSGEVEEGVISGVLDKALR